MHNTNETVIFETPWIKVKRTSRGFDYLQRKGTDSVAVFLVRNNIPLDWEVLVRFQPLCIDNSQDMQLYPCPITGGMEPEETYIDCALRETLEESGYKINKKDIKVLTMYVVGTQTNEICTVFWADVTSLEPETATQDGSYFESISHNEWKPLEYLKDCKYVACQLGYYQLKEVLT